MRSQPDAKEIALIEINKSLAELNIYLSELNNLYHMQGERDIYRDAERKASDLVNMIKKFYQSAAILAVEEPVVAIGKIEALPADSQLAVGSSPASILLLQALSIKLHPSSSNAWLNFAMCRWSQLTDYHASFPAYQCYLTAKEEELHNREELLNKYGYHTDPASTYYKLRMWIRINSEQSLSYAKKVMRDNVPSQPNNYYHQILLNLDKYYGVSNGQPNRELAISELSKLILQMEQAKSSNNSSISMFELPLAYLQLSDYYQEQNNDREYLYTLSKAVIQYSRELTSPLSFVTIGFIERLKEFIEKTQNKNFKIEAMVKLAEIYYVLAFDDKDMPQYYLTLALSLLKQIEKWFDENKEFKISRWGESFVYRDYNNLKISVRKAYIERLQKKNLSDVAEQYLASELPKEEGEASLDVISRLIKANRGEKFAVENMKYCAELLSRSGKLNERYSEKYAIEACEEAQKISRSNPMFVQDAGTMVEQLHTYLIGNFIKDFDGKELARLHEWRVSRKGDISHFNYYTLTEQQCDIIDKLYQDLANVDISKPDEYYRQRKLYQFIEKILDKLYESTVDSSKMADITQELKIKDLELAIELLGKITKHDFTKITLTNYWEIASIFSTIAKFFDKDPQERRTTYRNVILKKKETLLACISNLMPTLSQNLEHEGDLKKQIRLGATLKVMQAIELEDNFICDALKNLMAAAVAANNYQDGAMICSCTENVFGRTSGFASTLSLLKASCAKIYISNINTKEHESLYDFCDVLKRGQVIWSSKYGDKSVALPLTINEEVLQKLIAFAGDLDSHPYSDLYGLDLYGFWNFNNLLQRCWDVSDEACLQLMSRLFCSKEMIAFLYNHPKEIGGILSTIGTISGGKTEQKKFEFVEAFLAALPVDIYKKLSVHKKYELLVYRYGSGNPLLNGILSACQAEHDFNQYREKYEIVRSENSKPKEKQDARKELQGSSYKVYAEIFSLKDKLNQLQQREPRSKMIGMIFSDPVEPIISRFTELADNGDALACLELAKYYTNIRDLSDQLAEKYYLRAILLSIPGSAIRDEAFRALGINYVEYTDVYKFVFANVGDVDLAKLKLAEVHRHQANIFRAITNELSDIPVFLRNIYVERFKSLNKKTGFMPEPQLDDMLSKVPALCDYRICQKLFEQIRNNSRDSSNKGKFEIATAAYNTLIEKYKAEGELSVFDLFICKYLKEFNGSKNQFQSPYRYAFTPAGIAVKFKTAAVAGSALGCFEYAKCLQEGYGVAADNNEAAKYLFLAAIYDFPGGEIQKQALNELRTMYGDYSKLYQFVLFKDSIDLSSLKDGEKINAHKERMLSIINESKAAQFQKEFFRARFDSLGKKVSPTPVRRSEASSPSSTSIAMSPNINSPIVQTRKKLEELEFKLLELETQYENYVVKSVNGWEVAISGGTTHQHAVALNNIEAWLQKARDDLNAIEKQGPLQKLQNLLFSDAPDKVLSRIESELDSNIRKLDITYNAIKAESEKDSLSASMPHEQEIDSGHESAEAKQEVKEQDLEFWNKGIKTVHDNLGKLAKKFAELKGIKNQTEDKLEIELQEKLGGKTFEEVQADLRKMIASVSPPDDKQDQVKALRSMNLQVVEVNSAINAVIKQYCQEEEPERSESARPTNKPLTS